MTVKEAALEVLRAAGRPLTVAEILAGIEAVNLFGSPRPANGVWSLPR